MNHYSLFVLTFANILMRFLVYPFNFLFSALVTLGYVVAATFLNLGFIFGGCFSDSWSRITGIFNQIAITRCGWLLFDSFAFLINQGKLFLSLFLPNLAKDTLNSLKEFTEPLTQLSMFHWDWQMPHQALMAKAAASLNGLGPLKNILLNVASEPVECISAAARMLRGLGKMQIYGLNPDSITEEQSKYPATLCLHGNLDNQSAWLSLGKLAQEKQYPGAIFTLNLPASGNHDELINNKIASIKALYGADFSINLIGHSKGAFLALCKAGEYERMSSESNEGSKIKVNKAILLGENPDAVIPLVDTPLIFSNGIYDNLAFFNGKDNKPKGDHLAKTGHLGLLNDPDTLEYCYENLLKK